MVVLLVPLVAVILSCYWFRFPADLLRPTEVGYLDSLQVYIMVVTDYPSPRKRSVQLTAEVLSRIDSSAHAERGTVYLYLQADSTATYPTLGDTLMVRTRVRRGGQIGEFDYGRYLRLQGVVGGAYCRTGQWRLLAHEAKPSWFCPKRWQHSVYEHYKAWGIQGAELGTLSAITLGYKEDLDPDVLRSFQKSGAAHVLAVSGLHTGIIYAVLCWLLSVGGRMRPRYRQRVWQGVYSALVLTALWGYALLTGMTPSVVRSVVMLTLLEIGRVAHRETIASNLLAATAFIVLVVRPTDLFSVSFQLSFAAVAAILLFYPLFSRLFPTAWIPNRVLRRIARYVAGILAVSLAAQLGTLPLTMYYFGQCSNYFLLTNLLVIPLAWLVVVGAVVLLPMGAIPVVGGWVAKGVSGLVWLLNHSVGWVEALPGSASVLRISLPMVVLLYGAMLTGYGAVRHRWWWLTVTAGCLAGFCYLYTIV